MKDGHAIIYGNSGIGKTTFLKQLCNVWAKLALNGKLNGKTCGKTLEEKLSRYCLLMPVLPFQWKASEDFEDILRNQLSRYSSLNAFDLQCISHLFRKCPSSILMILHNFNDMGYYDSNVQLVNKLKHLETRMLISTCPECLNVVQDIFRGHSTQVVEILGFDQFQIEKYITTYFSLSNIECRGIQLLAHLRLNCIYLMEVARYPVLLDMICFVWKSRNDLGLKLVDIYDQYVKCLLTEYCTKESIKESRVESIATSRGNIIRELSKLAYYWNDNSKLCCTLHLAESKSSLISCGLLNKMFVSYNVSAPTWQFPHISFQEYFVASYLSLQKRDSEVTRDFVDRCSSVKRIESNERIFQFLCGLNGGQANMILEKIITKITNKEECKDLLLLVKKILPNFKTLFDLPLPKFVQIDKTNYQEWFVKQLFLNDCRKYRNLETLQIDTDYFPDWLNEVNLTPNIRELILMESQNCSVKSFLGELQASAANKEVTDFSAMSLFARSVHKLEKLEKISILQKNALQEKSEWNNLASFAKSCPCLTQLNLAVTELTPCCLIKLVNGTKERIKLDLSVDLGRVENITMFNKELARIGRERAKFKAIHFKDLSGKTKGYRLGEFLTLVPECETIIFGQKSICSPDLKYMAHAMGKSKACFALKTLEMETNDLEMNGEPLRDVLKHTEKLEHLGLPYSGITADAFRKISTAFKDRSTCLRRLVLRGNGSITKNPSVLGACWECMPSLEVLDVSGCGLTSNNLKSCQLQKMSKLKILDLSRNGLYHEGTVYVAKVLMNNLTEIEAFGLQECGISHKDDVEMLLAKLTSCTKHLNISGNGFFKSATDILVNKHAIKTFQRLNIGSLQEAKTVENLSKELKKYNQDIKVYCDLNELIVNMH